MNKKLPEIIAPKVSYPCWMNGAFCITFVYSNKGNFVVKGYSGDIIAYLNDFVFKGGKYFANRVAYPYPEQRNYWFHYKNDIYIREPDVRDKQFHFKVFRFGPNKFELKFKRLPNKWIKEFDV